MKHMKNKYDNYYILKMDIAKFFQNIDKNILIEILKKRILDKKVLWLLKEIIYSNYNETGDKGLPIGNYTSQIFANIYLNELDWCVKDKF